MVSSLKSRAENVKAAKMRQSGANGADRQAWEAAGRCGKGDQL